ncbi:DUF551 domain-containing protein [Burkholderia multivorans]|uniref:DUF551 domain-containing protein n=1 Tax=Burkholderia multivorans TaxID=87883 RepID=UPI0007543781|nr:DUF551 domain-containing protein [Burkholderia multivorans]KWH17621.1 hypothetical protein WL98_26970 [Burkholderia multivorans]
MTEDQINRRWVEILLDTLSTEKPVTIGPRDASCFINALRSLLAPTQQPSGEVTDTVWISVDERLPEEGEAIAFVVHWPGDEFLHGRVLGGTFHSYGGKMPTFSVPGTGFKATYWMPLPTAPADAARAQGGES